MGRRKARKRSLPRRMLELNPGWAQMTTQERWPLAGEADAQDAEGQE